MIDKYDNENFFELIKKNRFLFDNDEENDVDEPLEVLKQTEANIIHFSCLGPLCEPLGNNHVKISGIVYNNR